jgi:hypothetical protein
MRASKDFDPQDPTEIELFGCDFVNDLPAGDPIVISPAPVVTIDVIIVLPNGQPAVWTSQSGVVCPDPLFATRLLAAPTFDETLVSVLVGGCQPGCQYKLTYTVNTVSGKSISLYAYIPPETSP